MNMTLWQKIKIGFAALTGGVAGLVKAALDWFNAEVLAKVKDKETAAKYLADIRDFRTFLCGVFARHTEWMTDAKRRCADRILAAIDALCAALADFSIAPEELDEIIDRVKEAVDAWRKARKEAGK